MNVENLLKVKAVILEEPKRFDMGNFVVTGTKTELEALGLATPKCGTVACIAGWGAIIAKLEQLPRIKQAKTAARLVNSLVNSTASDNACEFFDIDRESGNELFYESNWPHDLNSALNREERGTTGYAQVAAAAIDRFIACDGDWFFDKGPTGIVSGAGE